MTTSNFRIDINAAHSYQTCIATWGWHRNSFFQIGKWAIVNTTKYSPTTTRHQNKIIAKLMKEGYNIEYVNNLRRGVSVEDLFNHGFFKYIR